MAKILEKLSGAEDGSCYLTDFARWGERRWPLIMRRASATIHKSNPVKEPTVGIYDRDYYRDESPSNNWGIDGLTTGVKYLIALNVIVFLLQIFIVREVRISP